uniref:arginine/serine-rich coiled-coil protein 2-like isoform X2 n=1 Tax=Myxine glutinosa TaxID=7769 RepID=UPI00358E0DBE
MASLVRYDDSESGDSEEDAVETSFSQAALSSPSSSCRNKARVSASRSVSRSPSRSHGHKRNSKQSGTRQTSRSKEASRRMGGGEKHKERIRNSHSAVFVSVYRERDRHRDRHYRDRNRNRDRHRSRSPNRSSRSRVHRSKSVHRHSKSRRTHSHHHRHHHHHHRHHSSSQSPSSPSPRASPSPKALLVQNSSSSSPPAAAPTTPTAKRVRQSRFDALPEKMETEGCVEDETTLPSVPALVQPSSSPSSPTTSLPPTTIATATGNQMTPEQMALAVRLATLQARVLAAAPSVLRPSAPITSTAASRPIHGEKRKLLWQGPKEGEKSSGTEFWGKLHFGSKEQDVKFRKLMGMTGQSKDHGSSVEPDAETGDTGTGEVGEQTRDIGESGEAWRKQEEVFRSLDAQYAAARAHTHGNRGTGLGFASRFSLS